MIIVTVRDNVYDTDLAELRIEEVDYRADGWVEYSVRFIVDRGSAIGLHSRTFLFKEDEGNSLALLQTALATLGEDELVIEHGETGASDMERRQRGIGQTFSD